ncbi:MAG: hypothetical protein HQL94_00605 [Magnetococcales bacterium]|nr:hypothetical protein [Magnetococcales bacterium]
MPTMEYLSNPENRHTFLDRVAKKSGEIQHKPIELNHGISSAQEILNILEENKHVKFNYARLMSEADEYV